MPTALVHAFLQHIRDFDSQHLDCHFEMGADIDKPIAEIIEMLRIHPELTITKVFEREQS
jgi:hypothetical protein